jgi:hypothetical protein
MKSFTASMLLGLAAAHSNVLELTIDGTNYPARAGTVDYLIKARKIEWGQKNPQMSGLAAVGLTSNALACMMPYSTL